MANCTTCNKSNLGMGSIKLLWIDGTWYCRLCLTKQQGLVKCDHCTRIAFTNDDNFKRVDARLMCETCMVKRNIPFSTLSIAHHPAASGSTQLVENLSGALQGMLATALLDSEEVIMALNGNSGEAVVITPERVLVLKAGLAAGSLLAKKVHTYSRQSIQGAECTASNLYGVMVLAVDGAPKVDVRNINVAKKMEHAVTFLARDSEKFGRAVATIAG